MKRLKLKVSYQRHFITMQLMIGTHYPIRSNPSLIYKYLRKKLNVTYHVPGKNWKEVSFRINCDYFNWSITILDIS